ncbi:O-antigen ligase domain-containing protein [Prauserella shujinwangii]|uniref:O-antigen ligase domain-containing protein n=1 Tax=Prauserella shujinwangii TaxID=1453103 RepID=UPI001C63324B|nr:O-antigen ligase domain-containing protein [Prauserella shujinwangii]
MPGLVAVIWGLLVLNTLGSTGAETIVQLPRLATQVLTMGALVLAFVLALALNPRLRVRPSAYLLLLSLLLVVSLIASVDLESGLGALFRCARLAVFIATLWLLSRWWDGSLAFVRHHIRVLGVVLASVAIGVVASPGLAFPDTYGGRLVGALWPLTAPQVGQYAAIVAGLTILLWLARRTDGRSTLLIALPALAMLLLSHTRTATVGLVAALGVAGLSLVFTSTRARRAFGWTVAVAGLLAVVAAPAIQAWFQRGQTDENFSNLTGRAKVWDALLAEPRSAFEELFGVGLTDKSFDGLPIDSSWLAVYHEQGYLGIALVAAFLGTLLIAAVLRPPSPARACALFLIVYCLAASYTEAGLGDASPYLLHLVVASALLTREEPR